LRTCLTRFCAAARDLIGGWRQRSEPSRSSSAALMTLRQLQQAAFAKQAEHPADMHRREADRVGDVLLA
jgi:hypothetical protein